jgi:hypothetical protein
MQELWRYEAEGHKLTEEIEQCENAKKQALDEM